MLNWVLMPLISAFYAWLKICMSNFAPFYFSCFNYLEERTECIIEAV